MTVASHLRMARLAAILISSPAISRRRFLAFALRDCHATPPNLSKTAPSPAEP